MGVLELQNIGDRAYDVLLGMIIGRKLLCGERLIEEQLAMELGISRTPLREAVNRLAKEGLVEIEPRKGARVKRFNIEDVVAVYDIRAALEGLAGRLAAGNVPLDKLKELRKRFGRKDTKVLIKADSDLHALILQCCGNARLMEMAGEVRNLVQVFRVAGYGSARRSVVATEDHVKIIDALIDGKGAHAERLMKKHIEKTKEAIVASFNKEG